MHPYPIAQAGPAPCVKRILSDTGVYRCHEMTRRTDVCPSCDTSRSTPALIIDRDHAIKTQQALTGQARPDSISCYV